MLRMRSWPLQARVLLSQVAIVGLVAVVTCASLLPLLTGLNEQQYAERALAVAQMVARLPAVRAAFAEPDPATTIQPLAETVRQASGVAFIVVSNRASIRYSHPNPALVGRPLSEGGDPDLVRKDDSLGLDGQTYIVHEVGSLGPSIRAKVPILADDGRTVMGVVSVGILEQTIQPLLLAHWPGILLGVVASLLVGAVGSWRLAGRIKSQIFGLEPREIAALLEQREAMLYGIREGVLAVDREGCITLVNEEARRVLDLPPDLIGRPIAEVLPRSGLPDVLRSGRPEADQVMVLNGRQVVVSRIPVSSRGIPVGAIATLRDQTETQALLQELSGTRAYLDALRAQAHEFANKLHTIAGLLELGWSEQAVALINRATREQQSLVDELPQRIADPALAALLVGKASVAAERGIGFRVTPGSRLRAPSAASGDLVTIAGNLIENAFDAVEGSPERWIWVCVSDRGDDLRLVVRDSGSGIPPEVRLRLFEDGFTTKPPKPGLGQRGVGLALVRHAVERLGGEIEARNAAPGTGGAVFAVRLPLAPARLPAPRRPASLSLAG